jgi:hypothetical protein
MPLTYNVRWGKDVGLTLKPHRHKQGYLASKSKFGPHKYVNTEQELIPYLQKGWCIRMSAPDHASSLICANSVEGWKQLAA